MCGVLGFFETEDVITKTLIGLSYLQRRGYDSAGIGTRDNVWKTAGKVENLKKYKFPRIYGSAIGHVRYATSGTNIERDAQPLYRDGIVIAHNGEILNLDEIKIKYKANFETGCDLEGILAILNKDLSKPWSIDDIINSVEDVMENVKGAYSVLAIIGNKMVAFRDPYGIRPLVRTKNSFASESLPLEETLNEKIYDVQPGSVVIRTKEGEIEKEIKRRETHYCGFEYAYFAHQNSKINGISVMKARERIGKTLSKYASGDAIVPIPNTPIPIASKISKETGIELKTIVVKESKERIFQKSERNRRNSYLYYTINRDFVGEIKKITLVDDSIVRGTNIREIIKKIRNVYGQIYINVVIGFPKIVSPCPFGIDMKTRGELIAVDENYNIKSNEEIAREIGANELHYISRKEFIEAIGNGNLCMGCTTGYYPGIEWEDVLKMEKRRIEEREKM